jgi:hypothetical protein
MQVGVDGRREEGWIGKRIDGVNRFSLGFRVGLVKRPTNNGLRRHRIISPKRKKPELEVFPPTSTAGEMPPRRRDRRRPPEPSPPPSDARAPPSASGVRLTRLALVFILVLVLAALGFSGRFSRSPPQAQTLQTTTRSVYERGLVKRDVSAREILTVSTSSYYPVFLVFLSY